MISDAESHPGSIDDYTNFSTPEKLVVIEEVPVRKPRHMLPGYNGSLRQTIPVLPRNSYRNLKNTKRRSTKTKSDSQHPAQLSTPNSSPIPEKAPKLAEPLLPKPALKVIEPKETEPKETEPKEVELKPLSPVQEPLPATVQSLVESLHSDAAKQAEHHRDEKDDFLVKSKLAGMSYKEIREKGGFTEAESTLRGRFRTLTKHKAARVRRPEWQDYDVRIHTQVVVQLLTTPDMAFEEGRSQADQGIGYDEG